MEINSLYNDRYIFSRIIIKNTPFTPIFLYSFFEIKYMYQYNPENDRIEFKFSDTVSCVINFIICQNSDFEIYATVLS